MQTAWKFKLSLTVAQKETMESWQHSVGYFYNFCLGDRIRTYRWTKIAGNFCDIRNKPDSNYVAVGADDFAAYPLTCSVNKSASVGYPWKTQDPSKRRGKDKSKQPSPKRTAYEMHSSLIAEWRQAKTEYKNVCADVLQQALRHLDKAFSNFFNTGAGYPNFKQHYRVSFEFKPGTVRINDDRITFPVLGTMRFFKSRFIPDGWEIRTVTISREPDGWYVSILLRDLIVPDITLKSLSEIKTIQGADVGIKKLVSLSDGTTIPNPQLFKKFERRLGIRQRRVSRKKRGSRNRKKARVQVARLHQQIRRLREDYQWKTASKIAGGADVTVFEELKVKNMIARCKPKKDPATGRYLKNGQKAKSQLNKAISDAAWYSLRIKTEYQASLLGNWVVTVNPHCTSQECSECHYISPDNRDGEKFVCEMCGHYDDADVNAAINQAHRGAVLLGEASPSKPACKTKLGIETLLVVSQKVTLTPELTGGKEITLPLGGVPENPAKSPVKQRQLLLLKVESIPVSSKPYSRTKRRVHDSNCIQLNLFDSRDWDAEESTS